jgi:hypothetical protein
VPAPARREVLAALSAGGLALATGCGSDGGGTGPPTSTTTGTDSPRAVTLRPVADPTSVGAARVVPAAFREFLAEATEGYDLTASFEVGETDGAPEPVLPAFGRLRLRPPGTDEVTSFEGSVTGGPLYDREVRLAHAPGAVSSSVYAETLPDRTREFLLTLLPEEGWRDTATIDPTSERGRWILDHGVDTAIRYEGHTYRIEVVDRPEAARWATVVWYDLNLDRAPETDGRDDEGAPELRLDAVPPSAETLLCRAIDDARAAGGAATVSVGAGDAVPAAVRSLARSETRLLAHTAVYAVSADG